MNRPTTFLFFGLIVSCGPATFESAGIRQHAGSQTFQDLASIGRRAYPVQAHAEDRKGGIMSFDANRMPPINRRDLTQDSREAIKIHLGFSDDQLKNLIPAKNHMIQLNTSLLSLNYAQAAQGIALKDAFVEVVYFQSRAGTYHLREIIDRSFRNVEVVASADTPTLSDVERATERSDFSLIATRSIIFPRMGDQGLEFLAATEFDVQGANELDSFFITLANHSRELLEVQSKAHHLTQLNAEVLERSYFYDKKMTWQIPQTKIDVAGSKVSTDMDGEVDLADSEEVVLELNSPRVRNREKSASGGGYELEAKLQTNDQGQAMVMTDGTDFRALNSYLAIHRAINYALQFVAEDEVPYFGNQIDLVFDYSGTCNAFYTSSGDSIRLYGSGGGCGAMAVVNDVIFHEWGHGYDYHTGRSGGISDGAFSEGIGDIIAAYMTKSPNMGPGFRDGSETGIRNLDNNRRYPEDRGEVHYEGTIIGGAFWDLRVMLVDRYGESRGSYLASHYFFRHLLSTDSYRDSYDTVLKLDDDDGNGSTLSPNHCLINEAFAKHGLAEEENCQDDFEQTIPADTNIFFALVDDKLAVSTLTAHEVIICEGDASECLKSIASDVELTLDGQKNGRRVFISKNSFTPKEQTVLTAISKNSRGDITGYRSIKIAGK